MAPSTDEATATAPAASTGPAASSSSAQAADTSDPGWFEPPLPNNGSRTYLTGGGSAVVGVVFLVFVAILLAYFSSAMSWAPW
jgi:hypothetical protein